MIRILVSGDKELHAKMVDATGRLEREVARVGQRAGTRMRRKQRAIMREDTGAMKRAVRVRTKRTAGGFVVTVGPRGVRQGFYQEYGTSKVSANPAVMQSLDGEEHQVVSELMDVVGRAIR